MAEPPENTPPPLPSGFQENRLIRCVKDKEKELRLRLEAANLKLDMKAERWFLTRFYIASPYDGLRGEFADLAGSQSPWEAKNSRSSSFVEIADSILTTRQLKINAHRIGPLYGGEYVACEGPTYSSIFDFWDLVWQENVRRIVSVNFPYEERLYPSNYDPEKETVQYWPIDVGVTENYMPYRVTCLQTKTMNGSCTRTSDPASMVYRVTRLHVARSDPICGVEPARELIHVCYYRWPDGRLPIPWPTPDAASLADVALRMIEIVQTEIHDPAFPGPLLVHCHAGLGRTGVFISLDIALRQLKETNTINVKGVVEKLRECRSRSVMNPWQYAYINMALAERALQMGNIAPNVGGHNVRGMLDDMWSTLSEEVNRQFNGQLLTYQPEVHVRL